MLNKNPSIIVELPRFFTLESVMPRLRLSLPHIVALVSLCAGVGRALRVQALGLELISPLTAAVVMALITFAGWYVWGFFTHLADAVLFGGHADYRGTLVAFGSVYVLQIVFLFTSTSPSGWLWGWIALYLTVAAWGIVGPRRLGMRTWQALVAATSGMLVWLACLGFFSLATTWPGLIG